MSLGTKYPVLVGTSPGQGICKEFGKLISLTVTLSITFCCKSPPPNRSLPFALLRDDGSWCCCCEAETSPQSMCISFERIGNERTLYSYFYRANFIEKFRKYGKCIQAEWEWRGSRSSGMKGTDAHTQSLFGSGHGRCPCDIHTGPCPRLSFRHSIPLLFCLLRELGCLFQYSSRNVIWPFYARNI